MRITRAQQVIERVYYVHTSSESFVCGARLEYSLSV